MLYLVTNLVKGKVIDKAGEQIGSDVTVYKTKFSFTLDYLGRLDISSSIVD